MWEPKDDFAHSGVKIRQQDSSFQDRVPTRASARKSNFSETYLGHGVTYVIDNKSRVIVGADRNLPNRNADAKTAVELVGRLKWNYHLRPRTLGEPTKG